MTQERIRKPAPQERRPAEEEHAEVPAEVDAEAQALQDATDELLDEIDAVLEEQDVLVDFVQRGGQ